MNVANAGKNKRKCTSAFFTRELGRDGFQDAQRAKPSARRAASQASPSKELLELVVRSLATPSHHEHVDIEQLTPWVETRGTTVSTTSNLPFPRETRQQFERILTHRSSSQS